MWLEAAEALVVCFPIWCFGPPAVLKGFFDRVPVRGLAFCVENGRVLSGWAIADAAAPAHPSALPFFLAGPRISSRLALIGAVVAEFVAGTGGNSAGLAYEIMQSGFQLDIPCTFAALFLITLTGIALMLGLQRPLLGHWHESTLEPDR